MKRKIVVALVSLMLIAGTALPALASSGGFAPNTTKNLGAYSCGPSKKVQLRLTGYDFFWFDSTGNYSMKAVGPGGSFVSRSGTNVEFDGGSFILNTPFNAISSATFKTSGLSSVGAHSWFINCI